MHPQVKGLVPRFWYQDLRRARGGASRWGTGAASPSPGGLRGWKPPEEQQGVWAAAAPPVKNNFIWTQISLLLHELLLV